MAQAARFEANSEIEGAQSRRAPDNFLIIDSSTPLIVRDEDSTAKPIHGYRLRQFDARSTLFRQCESTAWVSPVPISNLAVSSSFKGTLGS
jgi:hypothetical protein